MNTREEKTAKLNEIYKSGEVGGDKAAFFLAALKDSDYLVRTRAFGLAERVVSETVDSAMLEVIFGDEPREWQLRALNALSRSGSADSVAALVPLLSQCTRPLLLRGTLWVMASATNFQGETALKVFADFITGPYVGYLKVGFVADSLFYAISRSPEGEAIWKKLCDRDQAVAKAYSYYRRYVSPKPPQLQVYPYPDYLTKNGAKQGITPKELKYALYFKGKSPKK